MRCSSKAATTIRPPRLVLYRGATRTGCGQGAVGDGALLLSGRQHRLHRSLLLSGHARQAGADGDFAQG